MRYIQPVVIIIVNVFSIVILSMQVHELDIGSEMAFKLLRCLAPQLKAKFPKEDQDCIKLFLLVCCSALKKAQDFATDEKEFIQGVLSLYHLVNYTVNLSDCSETVLLLSQTLLCCLQKFSKTCKDVESIAANSFTPVWSAASKMQDSQKLSYSYRLAALSNLVHGGSNYWHRLVEKLMYATQETSLHALQLAEAVFDEFVFYTELHNCRDLVAVSTLLQIWMLIIVNSSSTCASIQHEKRNHTMKMMIKPLAERKQIVWLMELVLNIFGTDDNKFEVSSKQLGEPLAKDLEISLVRIVQMTLYRSNAFMNPADSKTTVRKNRLSTAISLLLFFVEIFSSLTSVVEVKLQLEPFSFKTKCLQRAGNLCCYLLRADPSRLDLSHTLFQLTDQLLWQNLQNQSRAVNTFLSSLGSFLFDKFRL